MDGPWQQYSGAPAPAGPWQQYAPPQDQPSVVGDVAKSFGTGLEKFGIDAAGSLGDVRDLAGRAAEKLGVSPSIGHGVAEAVLGPAGLVSRVAPTSSDIRQKIEGVTGPMHQPQTTAGEYAQTAGEFLPGVLGGEGSVGARLLKMAALPAVGSETAGQLTKGTAAEPYARVAGAVAGGLPALLHGGAEQAAVPAAQELKAAAQAGYRSPEVAAVQIKPQAVSSLATQMQSELLKAGFRPTAKSASDTFGIVGELRVPNSVSAVSVADLDTARQALGNLAKEVDGIGQSTPEAAAAKKAIAKIDGFLPNLQQADLLAGDAVQANSILKEARANYRAYKGVSLVDTKQSNAEIQAASTYGGGNINNATRQAFRPLLKNNAAGAQGLGQDAIPQLERLVKGGAVGNIARQVGRLAPSGPVNMGIHLGAALGTGGATIPVAVGAHVAKKIGEAITRSEVEKLRNAVAKQSPLFQQRQAMVPAPVSGPMLAPIIRNGLIAGSMSPPPFQMMPKVNQSN